MIVWKPRPSWLLLLFYATGFSCASQDLRVRPEAARPEPVAITATSSVFPGWKSWDARPGRWRMIVR